MSVMRIRNQTQNRITYAEQFIVSFLRDEPQKPRFVGSGFIISQTGLFVSARHVLQTQDGKFDSSLFAIIMNSAMEPEQCRILQYHLHESADVAIGILEPMDEPDLTKVFPMDCLPLNRGPSHAQGEIVTHAFPKSTVDKPQQDLAVMHYTPSLYYGTIENHLDRFPMVPNPGYQCRMQIEGGCSGAPVISVRYNCIIGVNSTSFDLPKKEAPLMYASDIALVFDLKIQACKVGDTEYDSLTIKELMTKNYIR